MSDAALAAWWDFANQKTLAARQGLGPTLGITRTTEEYRYNSAGILVAVPAGVAAFDHDPITRVSLGLSVWEARTNLALFSRDMSNAVHVATNITKGSTSVLDPTNTANVNVRLTASASNGTLLQTVTSASANRAFAPFIKRVTGSGNIQVTTDGGATWTTVTVTSDWTRPHIAQAAVTNPQFGVRIVTSGDAIDYWGPDLQTGLFITPHIPTVASSVTRNKDAISTTELSWYNQAAGTFYVAVSQPIQDIPFTLAVEISDSSSSDFWNLGSTGNSQQVAFEINSSAGNGGTLFHNGIRSDNTLFRLVGAATLNDAEFYADGARSGTGDQSIDMPTNFNKLSVGIKWNGDALVNGHIAELRYYNVRKDNQFLEDLSNGLIIEGGGGAMELLRRRRGR